MGSKTRAVCVAGSPGGSLVAGDCGASLQGQPGQPVTLDVGSALGLPHAPTITVGTAGVGTKTFSIPGTRLLDAVGGAPLAGVAVPQACQITVTAAQKAERPVQEGAKATGRALTGAGERVGHAVGGVGRGQSEKPLRHEGPHHPSPGARLPATPQQPAHPGHGSGPCTTPAARPAAPTASPALGRTTPGVGQLASMFPGSTASLEAFLSVGYGTQMPGSPPLFGRLGQGEGLQEPSPPVSVRAAGSAEALPTAPHASPGVGHGGVGCGPSAVRGRRGVGAHLGAPQHPQLTSQFRMSATRREVCRPFPRRLARPLHRSGKGMGCASWRRIRAASQDQPWRQEI